MKRSARLAAAALAASLSVGIAAPTVAAKPDRASHAHHAVKPSKADKGSKASKALQRDKRHVLRDVAHLDQRLVRVAREARLARLAADDKAAVQANVASDRSALADLAVTVKAADSTTDLKRVRADLKQVRVSNYTEVINLLRATVKVDTEVDALYLEVEADSPEALLLDEALAALDEAVAGAQDINAHSTRAALRAVYTDLTAAKRAVEEVKELLADGDGGTDDDGTDDDGTDDDGTDDDGTGDDGTGDEGI